MKFNNILIYWFNPIIIVATFLHVAMLLSCNSVQKKEISENNEQIHEQDSTMYAHLHFFEDFYDFGSIKQGEVVSYTFKFTNTGNSPLVIKDIIPDCGCTKSKVSSKLVKPNEVETIEVIFDSSGWRGVQYKSITVSSNGKIKEKSVTIKANVVI
ncbi:MAG TPA: DUF1573 domain-containing protein [Tenuifilaceae bacterium]|nr:DUF1573 domain-containing protein [Tenuifilaceae bacterium]HPE18803.1 DUF1573 domain-containing protein [Tenuifilaceae bacterium]HPJ46002.1 DUF1573 domain-containing protein [Tenuifilaceae bacterium]HPQ34382.1 DUF1573 domain-containing protein [Tenuifilaceae bacterium]HRX68542.1 DUF1573 domain-containing protein [Tenuifilaceae bacterium]